MDNDTDLERQANGERVAEIQALMREAITRMRTANCITGLRCRSLSEAITCIETSYLWMREVPGNEVGL